MIHKKYILRIRLKKMQKEIDDEDIFWKIQLNNDQVEDNSDDEKSTPNSLGTSSKRSTTTWLAPQEREGLNYNKTYCHDENENENLYEWIHFPLLGCYDIDKSNDIGDSDTAANRTTKNEKIQIDIRSVKSNVTLLESHVGEEIWDAAKLFAKHLFLVTKQIEKDEIDNHNNDDDDDGVNLYIPIKNKKVLELGTGCGLLGLVSYACGASQVLCTDYLPEVMDNLIFNLNHNLERIQEHRTTDEDTMANSQKNSWIKCSTLDWSYYIKDDLKDADWMLDGGVDDNLDWGSLHETDDCFLEDAQAFIPDIIIGSALVYSPQGGICCADVIQTYFESHEETTTKVYILQMTERPGFDQFLLRLEHWGLSYQMFEVSNKVYNTSTVKMPREAFKWIKVEQHCGNDR